MQEFFKTFTSGAFAILLDKVILIAIILIVSRIASKFITKTIKNSLGKSSKISERKAKTLSSILCSVVRYIIDFIVVFTILTKGFGIDSTSIIAIFSVFSVAIGLGAQNFIKDIITGFFFVLEDQFGVGDYVSLDARTGIVEAMGLRTTNLRSDDGYLYIIPNSQISVVTNMCKGFLRAIIDVVIFYSNDIDKVIDILNDEMKLQKQKLPDLKGLPEVLGITKMGGGTVEIRIVSDCGIGKKGEIERELRKAIKERFEKEDIQ